MLVYCFIVSVLMALSDLYVSCQAVELAALFIFTITRYIIRAA